MIRKAVGAIIINEDGKLLLVHKIRRGTSEKDYVSLDNWDFIKGGINDGESSLAALNREIGEEIDLSQFVVIGELYNHLSFDFDEQEQKDIGYQSQDTVMYLVKISNNSQMEYKDGEIDNFIYVAKEEVEKHLTNKETKIYWRKSSLLLYHLLVDLKSV